MMESMEVEAAASENQWNAPNCQNLHQTLNEFRLANILCDVVIMDDASETTPAHSCILAAASPVLKSTIMLKDTNKMLLGQGLTLMISGISVEVWRLLLEYLYLNTLVIPAVPGLLEHVLVAANMLGMKDLIQLITNHVTSAGIQLGPTPETSSLKITLAPTRPVSQSTKSVQTGTDDVHAAKQYIVQRKAPLTTQLLQQQTGTQPQLQAEELGVKPAVPINQRAAAYLAQHAHNLGAPFSLDVPAPPNEGVKSELIIKCRFCRMEFDRKANLVEHVADWCTGLNKPFIPSELQGRHAPNVDPANNFESQGDGKIYKCINPKCGRFFKTSTAVRRHAWDCILGVDTIRPMEQLVDLTDGSIMYSDGLAKARIEDGAVHEPRAYLAEESNSHNVPLKARTYQCAHCSFVSKRERMAAHLSVHHGKRKPFSCRECGMRYGYYDSLRDHYVGVHTEQQFTCTECGKVFKRSIMLRRHQLYEHTREGKALFPCKGCGKKFKSLAHARRHELYHNPMDQRRRFACDECNKLFCTKQDLERHCLSVHSDVKPYKCSRCPYSTPRKFYLSQHEKKHGIVTGRFICVTCDRIFVSDSFFRAHLREKHHQGADILQIKSDAHAQETVQQVKMVEAGGEASGTDVHIQTIQASSQGSAVYLDGDNPAVIYSYMQPESTSNVTKFTLSADIQ